MLKPQPTHPIMRMTGVDVENRRPAYLAKCDPDHTRQWGASSYSPTNREKFEDLYHRYADSWRIPPDRAPLCKERKIETGIPGKPFYASDLNREQYEQARAICTMAGIKEPSALDDCTLDVTVLGNAAASNVFVRAPVPVAVMQAGSRR
jgi:hypothetical protein